MMVLLALVMVATIGLSISPKAAIKANDYLIKILNAETDKVVYRQNDKIIVAVEVKTLERLLYQVFRWMYGTLQ